MIRWILLRLVCMTVVSMPLMVWNAILYWIRPDQLLALAFAVMVVVVLGEWLAGFVESKSDRNDGREDNNVKDD